MPTYGNLGVSLGVIMQDLTPCGACVLETAGLAEAEFGEYCRARGLFPEQVRSWRAVCESAFGLPEGGPKADSAKVDRRRIRELERDIGRKDRALAETPIFAIMV